MPHDLQRAKEQRRGGCGADLFGWEFRKTRVLCDAVLRSPCVGSSGIPECSRLPSEKALTVHCDEYPFISLDPLGLSFPEGEDILGFSELSVAGTVHCRARAQ